MNGPHPYQKLKTPSQWRQGFQYMNMLIHRFTDRSKGAMQYPPGHRRWQTMPIFTVVACGIAIGLFSLIVASLRTYQFLIILAVGITISICLATKMTRQVLLVTLVLSIPIFTFSIVPFSQPVPYNPSGAPPVIFFRLFDFPFFALLGLAVLEHLVDKKPFRINMIDIAAIGMIGWGILTIYNASYPEYSLFESMRLIKFYILAKLVADSIRNEADLNIVIVALMIGAIMQGLVGIAQYTINADFGLGIFTVGDLRRVTGTLGWPNTLGAYAGSLFMIAFVLWISSEKFKWLWVSCMTCLMLLILSYSRGAWIATCIALAIGSILLWRGHLINFKALTKIGILLCGEVIILMGSINSIVARIDSISPESSAIDVRIKLNQIAVNIITTHPLLGVGLNNYMQVMTDYDITGITSSVHEPVHNVFLLIGAETGLIGLALFLMLIGAVLLTCWHVYKQGNHLLRVIAIGIISTIAILSITNLADVHLKTDGLFALFWCLIGLTLAIQKLSLVTTSRKELHSIQVNMPNDTIGVAE